MPTVYITLFIILDIIINCICLLLQFKMSKKYYKKYCKYCILKCQDRQTKQINKSISKRNLVNINVSLKRLQSGDIGFEIDNNREIENNNRNIDNKDGNVIIDDDGIKSTGVDGNSIALKTMRSVDSQVDV